jgi:hypothetical protein
MRWWPLLLLSGCGGDLPTFHPPAAITHDLKPGESIVCENTIFWIGLPIIELPVVIYQKHLFECHVARTS